MTGRSEDVKVLLVDDDPFVLKLLGMQLAQLGFDKVLTSESVDDALVHLNADTADPVGLVVTDLQMPGMDGVEFVRYLHQQAYSGKLLLLSGEDERTMHSVARLAKTLNLDLLGAMSKPVRLDVLAPLLGELSAPATPIQQRGIAVYPVAEIRRAITNGELTAHYQPKIALRDGAVVGVECLARWLHPADGLVFPNQFIAVAEQHGLIDNLTQSVLRIALRQAAQWQQDGVDIKVAVNISMDNLRNLRFPEMVAQALSDNRIGADGLVLEITESQLLYDPAVPLDILSRLRLKRICLSIDDFGTGHSSLAQLRDLPFDELKLDMGFVHGASRNPTQRAILEASIGMARQLGMTTVAEGVEDRDDWDIVKQLGCDIAQGYFCAKPMPGAALLPWMIEWQKRRDELTRPTS